MTTSHSAKRVLQGIVLGSLGGLVTELLQPMGGNAKSCTIDPFGSEICLPGQTPNKPKDPGDDEEVPPKDPKRMVIVPPCFGPCTQFPPAPPYRQFAEEAAPEPVVEPVPAEPIRPLWMKSDALDEAVAEVYLKRTLEHIAQGQGDGVVFDADADTVFIEVEGVRYREIINPHSLLFTNEVNQPAVNA